MYSTKKVFKDFQICLMQVVFDASRVFLIK